MDMTKRFSVEAKLSNEWTSGSYTCPINYVQPQDCLDRHLLVVSHKLDVDGPYHGKQENPFFMWGGHWIPCYQLTWSYMSVKSTSKNQAKMNLEYFKNYLTHVFKMLFTCINRPRKNHKPRRVDSCL